MIVCNTCGIEKEPSAYDSNYRYPDGKLKRCKACIKVYPRQYRKTKGWRLAETRYRLKKRYGITLEHFSDMVDQQSGMCANTGCLNAGTHVDHNHNNSQVRALLCSGCNLALGNLKEDQARISGLLEYARRFQ